MFGQAPSGVRWPAAMLIHGTVLGLGASAWPLYKQMSFLETGVAVLLEYCKLILKWGHRCSQPGAAAVGVRAGPLGLAVSPACHHAASPEAWRPDGAPVHAAGEPPGLTARS